MLNSRNWINLFDNRTVKDSLSSLITFEDCVTQVNNYISKNSSDVYDNQAEKISMSQRIAQIKQLISEYIKEFSPTVEGYVSEDGAVELGRLIKALDDELTDFGILSPALNDPDLNEIRINSYKCIWVEGKQGSRPYIDSFTHKPVRFRDADECLRVINKLLRFSNNSIDKGSNKAIGNGITVEGFRVAATGPYMAAAAKGKNKELVRSPSAVIRLFPEKKFEAADLVKFKTISNEMARFEAALGRFGVNILVVGKTGAGKTVNLQMIIDNVPNNRRTIGMERDSELKIIRYDADGNQINDAIQWEYIEPDETMTVSKGMPTGVNCFNQMMRMSPSTIVIGEMRSYLEYTLGMQAGETGHTVLSTGHAGTPNEAVERIVQSVMAANPNMSREDVLISVCSTFNIIIVQLKLNDSTRKVVQLCELCGVERDKETGILGPKVNMLFKYVPTLGAIDDEGHFVGKHYQVGNLSPALQELILLEGQTKEDIELLQSKITDPVEGTYDAQELPSIDFMGA